MSENKHNTQALDSVLVELNKVTKRYDALTALQEVSLTIKTGEVLGLFGHNGAGKTTLMKLILGLISADAGELAVLGVKPDSKEAWHSRRSIGYLPENVSFYDQLTGLEVLTYFTKLKGYCKQDALKLLEDVGLTHAMNRKVKTYSKGMRQRLGLAQAFIGKPKLLLLDEPTVGLDPIATAEFYQTVDSLKQSGTSIILCSHVLPGVEQHLDRAMILSQGCQLALGTLTELRSQANLSVTIKATGLNGSIKQDSELMSYLSEDNQTLQVPVNHKLATLQKLLSYPQIEDISVEPANLEKIYQYYLAQHKERTGAIT